MTGRFITFEGIEGCGKTTQARLLAQKLRDLGLSVVLTREPGGTPIAERIREVLLDSNNTEMADETEMFLYLASRAQHAAERVLPALTRGDWVICDRFGDSTVCYQGWGGGLDIELIHSLNRVATQDREPDMTFVLDIDVETGLLRARGSDAAGDRMEQKAIEYHQKVREGFLDLARTAPDRVKIIDGRREVEEIAEEIFRLVKPLIPAETTERHGL